jgi:hypothetical protein
MGQEAHGEKKAILQPIGKSLNEFIIKKLIRPFT